jgi:hypothetical protein
LRVVHTKFVHPLLFWSSHWVWLKLQNILDNHTKSVQKVLTHLINVIFNSIYYKVGTARFKWKFLNIFWLWIKSCAECCGDLKNSKKMTVIIFLVFFGSWSVSKQFLQISDKSKSIWVRNSDFSKFHSLSRIECINSEGSNGVILVSCVCLKMSIRNRVMQH